MFPIYTNEYDSIPFESADLDLKGIIFDDEDVYNLYSTPPQYRELVDTAPLIIDLED